MDTTKYEVNGCLKFIEKDDWENGCTGESRSFFINESWSANTQEELIAKLMAFCCVDDKEAVMVNACDEPGRIDIQVTENDDGQPLTAREWERFKTGEIDAWLCDYSFQVEEVTRKTAELKELIK